MPRNISIPRFISLPFGYRVTIKQVPYQDLLHLGTDQGAHWDADARVIAIDQDLPTTEKRYYLLSFLFHALLDCQHTFLDEELAKANDDSSFPTSRT